MKKYIAKNNKGHLFILIILLTLTDVASICVALVLNFVIDEVYAAIQTGEVMTLIRCAWLSIFFAMAVGVVVFFTQKMKAICVKRIMTDIRTALMNGIMRKKMSDFQETGTAEYVTILNQNMSTFEENYINNLISIYESVVSIILGTLVLVFLNPIIAVISIAAMSIPSLIPIAFSKRLENGQGKIMKSTAEYNSVVGDLLNGFEVIQSYRVTDVMGKRHLNATTNMEKEKLGLSGTMAVLYGVTNMAAVAVQLMIMTLAGAFAVKGIISIGSIIAVTQLSGEVINPAFELSSKLGQLNATKPICDKILEVIENEDRPEENIVENNKEMKEKIELENITFSYKESPVIQDVSASFLKGKKYAIMGKSGSGKSTILKLLAGYYDTYEGSIKVDGYEVGRDSALPEVTLISQDVFLFDDTIRNNITLYGDFSQKNIDIAVRQAGLENVLEKTEHGLDAMVGENGEQFSGGERQRIAIARALLHHKKILLLDEATSALDVETANKVEESFLALDDVTCIAVTHKMSEEILAKYDEVFIMENGKIVK